jgi:energy-converting hydrogenase Eha subunit E
VIDTGLQAWQIPIFVTGVILLLEGVVYLVLRARGKDPSTSGGSLPNKWIRTAGLVLLSLLALFMAVAALGPALADQLAGVTAAALAAVGVWLAWRSYQETVRLAEEIRAARAADPAGSASSSDPAGSASSSDPAGSASSSDPAGSANSGGSAGSGPGSGSGSDQSGRA